ncbi:hypothetical protein LEL_07521 [Akanthomyces lecanii RCEF 1005]|uniref:Uncharacterized protein n=1 Tax=Akanthomyces lecanii RCEF 1005 TaxID=1081108 RepID=A0A168FRH2_CORDF|nr:hypothetical protein LEL_07521 [Akanthomyces lecanii RCEF 1005]
MGMQGPLTAQALGRSPYDDVLEGEGPEDPRHPPQQYDQRGRPVNPDTKRINREIVRSHNEVMLVIGVAEPENPNKSPEAESQRRHDAHEEEIGRQLDSHARRAMEMVGLFGIHGLRQRILIYREYSKIPYWHLWQRKNEFSWKRDVIPGAAAGLFTNYVDRALFRVWLGDRERVMARRILLDIWSYFRTHLKYFASMQRLGLIPADRWLPRPSYFIPFTEDSPIPAPPPLEGFDPLSLLRWSGHVVVNATPFLVWVMVLRVARDLQPEVWSQIFNRLPSTAFRGRRIPPPPATPTPPPEEAPILLPDETIHEQLLEDAPLVLDEQEADVDLPPTEHHEAHVESYMNREDEYATDEDENERVNTTLISFDVEATEASPDAPPGLWSAELRPSQATDARGDAQPVYLDTLLTQLPALLAANIFTDTSLRLMMAAYEATALRLMARCHRLRYGLPCDDIYAPNVLTDLSWRAVTNLLGAELLHITISGEIWAVFTGLAQYFHRSDKEWKEAEAKKLEDEPAQDTGAPVL